MPIGLEWQMLATPQMEPSFLAADERSLYWVSPDVQRRNSFSRVMPLEGGEVVTLMTGRPWRESMITGPWR